MTPHKSNTADRLYRRRRPADVRCLPSKSQPAALRSAPPPPVVVEYFNFMSSNAHILVDGAYFSSFCPLCLQLYTFLVFVIFSSRHPILGTQRSFSSFSSSLVTSRVWTQPVSGYNPCWLQFESFLGSLIKRGLTRILHRVVNPTRP